MKKKLTIVCPVKNNAEYLKIFLDSYLATSKDMKNQEMMIIDDASTDNFNEVIEGYKKKIKNLKIVTLPINHGCGMAMNLAVPFTEGEYLMINEADMVFPKDWESTFYKHMNPGTLFSCGLIEPGTTNTRQYFVTKDLGKNFSQFDMKEFWKFEKTQRKKELSESHTFPFVIQKSMFLAVGGFEPLMSHGPYCDHDFYLKLKLLNCKFVRSNESYFYHFSGKGTRLANESKDTTEEFIKVSEKYRMIFMNKWGFDSEKEIPQKEIRGVDFSKIRKDFLWC